MPGVMAGLLLVFIPLAGDYITASVLGGAKGNMVGALVASQFQAAQNQPLGSAMAVVLIAMIMLHDRARGGRRARRPRADAPIRDVASAADHGRQPEVPA